jgi:hypothetical protein
MDYNKTLSEESLDGALLSLLKYNLVSFLMNHFMDHTYSLASAATVKVYGKFLVLLIK